MVTHITTFHLVPTVNQTIIIFLIVVIYYSTVLKDLKNSKRVIVIGPMRTNHISSVATYKALARVYFCIINLTMLIMLNGGENSEEPEEKQEKESGGTRKKRNKKNQETK
jgi:hypothetical protein